MSEPQPDRSSDMSRDKPAAPNGAGPGSAEQDAYQRQDATDESSQAADQPATQPDNAEVEVATPADQPTPQPVQTPAAEQVVAIGTGGLDPPLSPLNLAVRSPVRRGPTVCL